MRSIETLVRTYPNLSGSDIIKLQEQDKIADEKAYQKANKKKLEYIDDINVNGGYYMGRFGIDQRYIYNITKMWLEGGEIYMDVEKIIVFLNMEGKSNQVTNPNEGSIEKRIKSLQRYSTYLLEEMCERVSVKEWDEVNNYLIGIAKFWKDIK